MPELKPTSAVTSATPTPDAVTEAADCVVAAVVRNPTAFDPARGPQ